MSSQPTVAVFGSSSVAPGSEDWRDAERCGHLVATAGYAVATGGYGGVMEAVSKGAANAGGHVIGVTAPPVFRGRDAANAYVTVERPAPSLTERIHDLVTIADAAIALPGSIGTLTELLVAWNVAFVSRFNGSSAMPIVTVGATWQRLVAEIADSLATDGMLVSWAASIDDAVGMVTARLG